VSADPRDASRSDVLDENVRARIVDDPILEALLRAQCVWLASGERALLRRVVTELLLALG
jgi:hypothetical protein